MKFKGGYRSDDQRRAMFANMALKQGPLKISRFPVFSSQDIFSPDDQAYLDSLPEVIELGKYIDMGHYGRVFELKENPNFVVKVPQISIAGNSMVTREWGKYKNYRLEKNPLMVPTAQRYIKVAGRKVLVLVRPKLTIIKDNKRYKKGLISDQRLEKMRQNLIDLTSQGLFFKDRFQIGLSKAGEVYIYDLDSIKSVKDYPDVDPLEQNNFFWLEFLAFIFKNKEIPGLDGRYEE